MTETKQISWKILPARAEDLPVLCALGKETFLQAFADDNDPDSIRAYVQEAFSPDVIRVEYEHPESAFFILMIDGESAGYLKLNHGSAQTEKREGRQMEIERLYLLSRYKGHGLGQALMEHALSHATRNGFETLWLGVWEKNLPAIAFYEHLGFQTCGEHVFTIGTEDQRDLLMQRYL